MSSNEQDPGAYAGPTELSLEEVHDFLSRVLKTLHKDNLRLQERLGGHLNAFRHSEELIEELQSLDRQSQIMLDLSECLASFASGSQVSNARGTYRLSSLLRLDATRYASANHRNDTCRQDTEDSDKGILF